MTEEKKYEKIYLDPLIKKRIPGTNIKTALPRRFIRKEKPPRSMLVQMKYPSAPNYIAAGVGISLLILTIAICLFKALGY